MQSLPKRPEQSDISLGERRGKSDLARFSIDLSWARAVSDGARSRAYPSPPMSGSPPLPPRRNPESSDRGHGSYGPGQDIFRGTVMPQSEQGDQSRRAGAPLRPYQPELQHTTYSLAQMDDPAARYQYQQVPQQAPPQQQYYASHPQAQSAQQYSVPARQPIPEASEHNSPKAQRKTKGHVASACVPCKRAHLRCDAQRPCSRCLSNGKEDTCIDVQHKKRGRPRLRDERDPRYENVGPGFQPPPEGLRRPLSLYGSSEAPMSGQFGESVLQRSGSYRVLKSQGGGPVPSRYPEHVEAMYAALPPAPSAGQRMISPQEPMCAYLTMDLQIAKATQAFNDATGVQSSAARKLHDIVTPNDRDKAFRLQRIFEDERREREPNYLPPIYLKYEEDRVIESVGFAPEEMSQFQTNRSEMFTFQGSDGKQRTFHVRFGLAKKTYHQPSSSPYSRDSYPRESYSRDSQYGYQTPQQAFAQAPSVSPYGQHLPFGDARGEHMGYRPAPAAGVIAPPMPPASHPYGQSQARLGFGQTQSPYQTPRSELPPEAQAPPQRGLQLPPIRDQRGEALQPDTRRRDDRSGRVDIGGLLEKPDASRR